MDLVGSYNPKTKAATVNGDRIKEWVAKGAQVSPTAMNLFIREGLYEGKKFPAVSKKNLEKNKAKNEEAAAAATAAAEEAARAAAAPAPVEEAPAPEAAEVETTEEAPTEEVAEEAPAAE